MSIRLLSYLFLITVLLLPFSPFARASGSADKAIAAEEKVRDTARREFEKKIQRITPMIGPDDAVIVAGPDGGILYAKNENKPLVPASTLKVLTSLAAMHYLGETYRFPTRFYLDEAKNLTIQGFGDPLLISEEIDAISRELSLRLREAGSDFQSYRPEAEQLDANQSGSNWINDLVLDDSHYSQPIRIPGRELSLEPYDAPNGALCVNFNTVFFKTAGDRIITAEPQTPLLPLAREKIKHSGMSRGRITLSHKRGEILQYAGEMFRHFLEKQSIRINGVIRPGTVTVRTDRLVWEHASNLTLDAIIAMLLEYSNNFIANQLLLAVGAAVEGAPATLEKGVAAVTRYADRQIGISGFQMVEGAGLSRNNRISAAQMLKILDTFEPHYRLMLNQGNQYYKTGTLKGVSTRVGYILGKKTGTRSRFVIFLNTNGKSSEKAADLIVSTLSE